MLRSVKARLAAAVAGCALFIVTPALATCPATFGAATVSSDASCIFRDYSTDGVPGSGVSNPIKADIRQLFGVIGTSIADVNASQASRSYGYGLSTLAAAALTTDVTAIGYQAGQNLSGFGNTIMGSFAASGGTGAALGNSVYGVSAALALSTGGSNAIFGRAVAQSLTTGSRNIIIGFSTATDVLAANTNNEVNVGGLLFYNTSNLGVPAVVGGSGPTIDSKANNRSGKVTFGTGSFASGTITFAGSGYTSWDHCRITPSTAYAGFGYAYNLTTITIAATSLTSAVVDYDCDGY